MLSTNIKLESLEQTERLAKDLVQEIKWPAVIYLEGDLGAGKTTFCKALVAAYGYSGVVTSPTYNLIHEYPLDNHGLIIHIDLYRLNDPEELLFLGLNDLIHPDTLLLVEWPSKGEGVLPPADYVIKINRLDGGGSEQRQFSIKAIV